MPEPQPHSPIVPLMTATNLGWCHQANFRSLKADFDPVSCRISNVVLLVLVVGTHAPLLFSCFFPLIGSFLLRSSSIWTTQLSL